MEAFKRWAPFIGTVITVGCALLKALGYADQADLILRAIAFILPVADTQDQALATTAVASMVGLILQLRSRYTKARDKSMSIRIR